MLVLVINSGSSSLKYQLLDTENQKVIGKGLVERIGLEGSVLTQTKDGVKTKLEVDMPSHVEAVKNVFDSLVNPEYGLVKNIDEIDAIGHRVVHGGEVTESQVVTEELKGIIKEYTKFAPLHNPAGLLGIEACEKIVPGKPNVAVFDTAFHSSMPAKNYIYAIPYELYEQEKIRRYGFHGTSHKYVTQRTSEILCKKAEHLNLITIHLGNGSSIAAVKNGKSINTSMGLTPLEGLTMGTRTGDIDASIILFLIEELGQSVEDVSNMINKKSGALGVSGISSDFRDLEEAAAEGNYRAKLALDMFVQRARKYLGAFLVELGHVDAICFAGGIGENSDVMRENILKGLEEFGIEIDPYKNSGFRSEGKISSDESKIEVYVVPTNEELMIARETRDVLQK